MGLTQEQKIVRRGKGMASDISAFTGFNPHASAFDAWLGNLGKSTFEGNAATHMGEILEKVLVEEAAERLQKGGWQSPGTLFHPAEPWAGCTPDALFPDGTGIQIKNHGFHQLRHFVSSPDGIPTPHNDLIPEWHLVQCLWEMWVCNAHVWYLGCYFGGAEFRIYHLERDQELLDLLVKQMREFWKKHLDPEGPQDPPPIDGSAAATDFLRRAFPKNDGKMIASSGEAAMWAERYHETHNRLKEMERAKQEAQNHLIQMVGASDGIEGICTFKAGQDKPKTDWESVAKELVKRMDSLLPGKLDPSPLIETYTTTPEPSRRFSLKYKPEQG